MRNRSLVSRITMLIVAILLPLTALAGDPVGKMNGNSSSIEWSLTRSNHESVTLYVQAPDGTLYEKTFNGQQNPTFRLSDLKGALQDGVYSYELRVNPAVSNAVKSALKAARATGDDAKVAEILKSNGLTSQVVQSGAFGMQGGSFLDPSAKESDSNDSAAAGSARGSVTSSATSPRLPGNVSADDQVIPDDLIVQASICSGFDCVDGESFGVDTIRMKENNLRLHYDDTSTSAGYAANDWRIYANDQASGGANFYAVEDATAGRQILKLEAGAPANGIYLDSTGHVGIGNSNPGLDVHATTTDTPGVRLEQTNGGGFTAQTWDIGANEANFFIRDLTGGSRLSFRIRPGAPTSSIDIAASGNVGIGTATPDVDLHVEKTEANNYAEALIENEDSTGFARLMLQAGNGTASSDFVQMNWNSNRASGRHYTAGMLGTTSWKLYDVTSSTDRIEVTSGGNVGIGIAPTSKLHVAGDIRISGGSFIDDGTTLNVPDYVFEDSYKLMSMDELSSFIKTNKHLPNVPSAKDIAAQGVNMSKFQMNLLEKVEELTLYTVSQHEQIGTLKAQNDKLMERLAALEKAIGNK
jgi:hypothetical protein